MQFGQQFVSQIVTAVTTSPLWPRSALFLSYDEQGGLYDHVPAATGVHSRRHAADHGRRRRRRRVRSIRPARAADRRVAVRQARLRLARQVTDHTSILRFIEARFGLPALTHRDANAMPPFDMFDFGHADSDVPALPDAVVDPDQAAACVAQYPHSD